MKTNLIKLSILMAIIISLFAIPQAVSADTDGDYTYVVENGEATITGLLQDISGEITMPDTLGGYPVTAIAERAFEACKITGITIPDSVRYIRNKTFFNCYYLKRINIPNSVTYIGARAFYNCYDLTTITIPDSVTYIDTWAFAGSGLTSVHIPYSVTYIGVNPFYRCSSLEEITMDDNNSGYYTYDNILFSKYNKELYIVSYASNKPDTAYIIPDGVTEIGYGAFSDCSNLTNITIPYSVKYIGEEAFRNCSSLTNVNIPNSVTSIEPGTFSHCKYLKNIIIPDSVTSIGTSAFEACGSIESINIPHGVTSIGDWAFDECYALTSITMSNSIKSFGRHICRNCDYLIDIYFYGTEEEWHSIDNLNVNYTWLANATIHFLGNNTPYTSTSITDNDTERIFTVEPKNISNGAVVVLALYNGNKLVEAQYKNYSDSSVTFTTSKAYDTGKVMVWESLISLKPLTKAEIIDQD